VVVGGVAGGWRSVAGGCAALPVIGGINVNNS